MRCRGLLALLFMGCQASPGSSAAPQAHDLPPGAPTTEPDGPTTQALPRRVPGRPIVVITDPAQLARLEHARDFGALVFGRAAPNTRALHDEPAYRHLIDELALGGDDVVFPRWWLNQPKTSFELVAVVNRIDRRDFGSGPCGETRLIYRLGYADGDATQRLPLSFNVVFEQADDGQGCTETARRWMVEGVDPVDALTGPDAPLSAELLSPMSLLAIETNVRHGEGPGSSGRNEMRVLGWDRTEHSFHSLPLDFEPRYKWMMVQRQVKAWLTPEVLADIERGIGRSPSGMQTWASFSVPRPPHASEYAHMWWRLEPQQLPLPTSGPISTGGGLQHRLDGMSCSGCHSARSVAGFHLPGEGGAQTLRGGMSAHLVAELPWRERYVEALANGETPDTTRKLPDDGPAGFGRRCSVPGSVVDTLRCDDGFDCVPTASTFGVCLPAAYDGPGPCAKGDPDCWAPSPWFPDGFVRRACVDGQACAPVVREGDFKACGGRDRRWSCAQARAKSVRVDACTVQSDCRDGYACVEDGVCQPSASVAEFRIVGHAAQLR